MLELNKLYCENCLDTMAKMPDNFCDLTVTSPVYDNLRDYNGYSFEFEKIAQELYRITKNGGTVTWIVNDPYVKGSRSLTSFKQAIYFKEQCGFNIHDVMIYQKSGFNFPANNRYHQVYEFIHVASKGKPKTFNPIMDKKNAYPGQKAHGKHRGANENDCVDMSKIVKAKPAGEYGKRYNVWYVKVGGGHVAAEKIAHKHPAIFPESLAGDLITSFSNPGDLVYDPFVGSGTSAKMAKILNRNYIGSDISQEYIDIAKERINGILI